MFRPPASEIGLGPTMTRGSTKVYRRHERSRISEIRMAPDEGRWSTRHRMDAGRGHVGGNILREACRRFGMASSRIYTTREGCAKHPRGAFIWHHERICRSVPPHPQTSPSPKPPPPPPTSLPKNPPPPPQNGQLCSQDML